MTSTIIRGGVTHGLFRSASRKANKSMDGFCAAEKTLTLCKENSELFINEFLWV